MHEAARARVAVVLTDAVHALVADCTAAVAVVDYGAEWRLLAQRGPVDISPIWRHVVARRDRDGDSALDPGASVVVEIPFAGFRATLIVVSVPGTALPPRMPEIVRPLLDAAAILLAGAGSAAASERSLRLVPESQRWDALG
jgi:hypothetical protein